MSTQASILANEAPEPQQPEPAQQSQPAQPAQSAPSKPLTVVITGGGTAGHIHPALAVAEALRDAGHTVLYAGTPAGQESRIIPEAGFAYQAFAAKGFDRARPTTLVTSSLGMLGSVRKARAWLREHRPNVVAGFGGYVAIPVGYAAHLEHLPLLVHEQNSAAGMTNHFLARYANAVAVTYAAAAPGLGAASRAVVTGNPVRASFKALAAGPARAQARAAYRAEYGIPAAARVLLITGGSQGAQHLNNAACALAPQLLAAYPDLHVLHLTGRRDYAACAEQLNSLLAGEEPVAQPASQPTPSPSARERWHLIDYCDRMPEAYAASDLVVSRAGATSLAELAAMGMPAILVPFPHATDDHQTANARTLTQQGAAVLVADAEVDGPGFSTAIQELLSGAGEREAMAAQMRAAAGEDATQAVVNLLYKIAK